MSTSTFAQLLTHHLLQSGISDSELARSIGVRRQTVFRWKEGLVERPRAREDVLRCAQKLRLTPTERDQLLLAAGFAPERLDPSQPLVSPLPLPVTGATMVAKPRDETADDETAGDDDGDETDGDKTDGDEEGALASAIEPERVAVALLAPPADPAWPALDEADASEAIGVRQAVSFKDAPNNGESPSAITAVAAVLDHDSELPVMDGVESPAVDPVPSTLAALLVAPRPLSRLAQPRLVASFVLGVMIVGSGLLWAWRAFPVNPLPPTPTPEVVQITLNAPPPVYPVAGPGETLVLVAPFAKYTSGDGFNVAGRLEEALGDEIKAAGILSTTVFIWPDELSALAQARQVVSNTHAALLIWGEYDSGRVRVNWTVGDQETGQAKTEKLDLPLTSSTELNTTINTRVPQEVRMLALIALGRLLRDRGDPDGAAAAFGRALEIGPEDDKTTALLNFYLGHLAEQASTQASYTRALAYYNKAIELNGNLVDAYYNRGTAYLKRSALLSTTEEERRLQDLEQAIADFDHVLTLRPTSLTGRLNRGIAYYERNQANDVARAKSDFSQIITTRPTYARAYFHRGLVYLRSGNQARWVEDFTQAATLATAPSDQAAALNGLCWGYALDQQPELAQSYCDQAINLDTTGASRDGRGIVYAQLGDYPTAIADLTAYLTWIKSALPESLYSRYRGPMVETWIAQLQAAQNPFTAETLATLR